uniref:CARD domain-containing protein n=1 Tax=Amazona collaria TaxID=241587 RepID=A0A8B9IT12_9PSIT
ICVAGSSTSDARDNPKGFEAPHRVSVSAVGGRGSISKSPVPAHLPGAGIFQCSITGLGFKVKSAVTITYRYTTWSTHLSKANEEMWVPAGPLFDIKVQPRVVQKIYLPHFICLAEDVDTSQCFIAHFKSGAMMLERPTRVVAFSAVLRNPSFSLLGVLWRKLCSALHSFPVHSLVLIYQQLRAANTTFHLYLIPDDNSLKQVRQRELDWDWNSRLIPKPPPFSPLFFGCIYHVPTAGSFFLALFPVLPLLLQLVPILVGGGMGHMAVGQSAQPWCPLALDATCSRAALCYCSTVMEAQSLLGGAFLKKHKAKLCSRMRPLAILPHLRTANVINSDEEEELRGQSMSVTRNLILLDLIEKKGLEAQEQFYQILRLKDPFFVADLENSS